MTGLTIGNPASLAIALESANIIPGDVLQLRGGIYTLTDMEIKWHGTSSNHITLTNYPGEQVIFRPTSGVRIMLITGEYIDISGDIVFDGVGVSQECIKITNAGANVPLEITLDGIEIKNAPMQGVLISNNGTVCTLNNLNIHHNGTTKDHHGIYLSDGTATISGCECYNNSGHGIQAYGNHSVAVIYKNYCHNNGRVGIGCYSDSAIVYNNICRANYEANIRVRYSARNVEIYNNTCMDANAWHIDVRAISLDVFRAKIYNNVFCGGAYGVYIWTELASLPDGAIEFYNNLSTDTVNNYLFDATDSGTISLSNNIDGGGFSPVTDNAADVIIPLTGNPAKNTGVYIASVLSDYTGSVRNNPPSIGAYE